jgi:hypothetical protein
MVRCLAQCKCKAALPLVVVQAVCCWRLVMLVLVLLLLVLLLLVAALCASGLVQAAARWRASLLCQRAIRAVVLHLRMVVLCRSQQAESSSSVVVAVLAASPVAM